METETSATGTRRERTRILWCSASYGYAGELMYFRPILSGFAAMFPQTVIPVEADFPTEKYPDIPLAPVLRYRSGSAVPGRRARTRGYSWQRRSLTALSWARLLRFPADLYVIIEFTPTALAGFLISRLRRKPNVLLVEADPRYRGSVNRRLELLVKQHVARRSTHVLVSNSEAETFARCTLRVPPARLSVGPYLTSAPRPSADIDDPPAPCDRPGAPVRFLFANSITRRKGLAELLTALAEVGQDCGSGWTLDVVGTGDALPEVQAQVERLHLRHAVMFHGQVPYDRIWRYYRCADVVVCPTLADYRSLAGFEAVNAGKPVILSVYDGAAREIADSGAPASVVDPRVPAALAEVLRRYCVDPEHLASAQQAARHLPPVFGWEAVLENLRGAVDAAMADAGSGALK